VIVGYGRISGMPEGALPVFSCDTEEEARALLNRTCPKNYRGEFVAPELAEAQTLENLYAFGDRLQKAYDIMKSQRSDLK